MKILLLIPILCLMSCGGSSKRRDTAVYTLPTPAEVDLSGTRAGKSVVESATTLLMVNHWPLTIGDNLTIGGARATVTGVEVISDQKFVDLKRVTFAPALNLARHRLIPTGGVSVGAPVLIYRFDRPPLEATITDVNRLYITSDAKFKITPGTTPETDPYNMEKTGTNDIRYFDSDGIWLTEKDGVLTCVGITTGGHAGYAPNLEFISPPTK